MKKDLRDHLKAMPVNELQEKLQELETDLIHLKTKCKTHSGYPKERTLTTFGNVNNLKKNIARVKTLLNIKLKAPQQI